MTHNSIFKYRIGTDAWIIHKDRILQCTVKERTLHEEGEADDGDFRQSISYMVHTDSDEIKMAEIDLFASVEEMMKCKLVPLQKKGL